MLGKTAYARFVLRLVLLYIDLHEAWFAVTKRMWEALLQSSNPT
jgi:hypothetical protein